MPLRPSRRRMKRLAPCRHAEHVLGSQRETLDAPDPPRQARRNSPRLINEIHADVRAAERFSNLKCVVERYDRLKLARHSQLEFESPLRCRPTVDCPEELREPVPPDPLDCDLVQGLLSSGYEMELISGGREVGKSLASTLAWFVLEYSLGFREERLNGVEIRTIVCLAMIAGQLVPFDRGRELRVDVVQDRPRRLGEGIVEIDDEVCRFSIWQRASPIRSSWR
jgi:hypothetical protein